MDSTSLADRQLVLIKLMKALQLIKTNSNDSSLRWRTWFGYFWYLVIILLALPSISYMIVHRNDLDKIVEGNYFINAEILISSQWLYVNLDRKRFMQVLKLLQDNLNSMTLASRQKHYLLAHGYSTTFTKTFLILVSATFANICALSLFLNWPKMKADEPKHTWFLPIDSIMPFKITDGVTYSLAFFQSASALFGYCFTTTIIQVIISDICLNITACYKDVQGLFQQLDDIMDVAMSKQLKEIKLKETLRDTIRFHRKMFLLLKKIRSFLSALIFIEFFGMIFFIGVASYAIVQPDPSNPLNFQRTIKFILIWLVAMASLLMYSYLGTMTTVEVTEVSTCIYQLNWYLYPASIQKRILFILGYAQTSVHLTGMHFFHCNLATFKEVMNFAISLAVVLKSV